MTTAALAGSTGFVGSNILAQLLEHPSISSVYAYTRRDLHRYTQGPRLHPLQSADTSTWASLFPKDPVPRVFISALGTTRAAAGGVENQRKIDVDLNYDLAKAAKEAGCETYVLVSSGGANSSSMMAYPKMKGELEDKVKGLGFKYTVIMRPGLIGGDRQESRPAEAVMRGFAGLLKKVSPGLVDAFCQDADVIARAAIKAGFECLDGKREEGVWMLGQGDIVRLGKEEGKSGLE